MPVSDEEAAAVGLDRILESLRSPEGCIRRILLRERADVGDYREVRWSVHTVDPDDVPSERGADERHEHVGGVADERDVCRPAKSDDRCRQAARERGDLSGLGIHAEMRPAAPSVTYSAPSGPTVLPDAPCSPTTSRVGTDWAATGAGHAAVTRRTPSVNVVEFICASVHVGRLHMNHRRASA